MAAQARALLALGPGAVLLKGGHLPGAQCLDLLLTADGAHWMPGPRHPTTRTHGTGCTLSAALATLLGHGQPLPVAAENAKAYVAAAIVSADALDVGQGHGPTHHFHSFPKGPPL